MAANYRLKASEANIKKASFHEVQKESSSSSSKIVYYSVTHQKYIYIYIDKT